MNYTQNQKIEQVTESTLVLGVDIGSSEHYVRAFDYQGRELTRKVFRFSTDINGFNSFYDWVTQICIKHGSADAIYQYTDFGETMIQGYGQAKNEVCYTGGIYDQSTGLYYLNARYYNPVNYEDPSGHFLVSTAVLVGVGVGGIVGAIAGSYKGKLVAKRLGYKGKKEIYL